MALGTDVERNFLEAAFVHAKTFAGHGLSNLHDNPVGNVKELFQWLYGEGDEPLNRASARLSLTGISQNASPAEGEPQGGDFTTADVKVFCTHDRLREASAVATGEKRWFDPELKEYLTDKFDCATAFAWVLVPHEDDQDEQPDILQFCPWFLKYGMKQRRQFRGQFKPGVVATLIKGLYLDKLATKLKYTPVDLMELFDKVVVHELAHTRRGHELLDVGGFGGYGWKNCRKLSTEREDPNTPNKNADTLALFASISELIAQDGVIYEDGTFHRPGAQEGGDNAATNRRAIVPDQIPQFNASSLKGRPLF